MARLKVSLAKEPKEPKVKAAVEKTKKPVIAKVKKTEPFQVEIVRDVDEKFVKVPEVKPTYIIKKPLLADKVDDLAKLTFPLLATPKIDGLRAMRLGADLISRQFKTIRNARMRALLRTLLPEGSDGEIWVKGTFQDVSSAVMSSGGTENYEDQFTFFWFDYVKDDPGKPYDARMQDMKDYVEKHQEIINHSQAKIVPLYPVQINSAEELIEYETKMLLEGFEGVMVRKPSGPYKMGRSSVKEGILLKIKKFNDAEAVVVGVQELFHNTNEKTTNETGGSKRSQKKEGKVAAGKLGALIVEMPDKRQFNIGSGFTDAQRNELWSKKDSLIGKLVKYKYFEMGSKDAPRFPTFLGFRDPDDM